MVAKGAEMRKIPRGVGPGYPQVVVLVGATGDLSRRKLLPGLFHLATAGFIPGCRIIGVVARRDRCRCLSHHRPRCARPVRRPQGRSRGDWASFSETLDYVPAVGWPGRAQGRRRRRPRASNRGRKPARSLPQRPARRGALPAVALLAGAGLSNAPASSWRSRSAPTSRAPSRSMPRCTRSLREDRIFRIDHFLGKEPAQNILAFRFANGLFEPIWNRNFIDHVQIDVPETLGLDQRGPLLRGDRRLSRHGGDASVPDSRLHGDGAADGARTGADQRRKKQGLPRDAADRPEGRRARPIYGLSRARRASIPSRKPKRSLR